MAPLLKIAQYSVQSGRTNLCQDVVGDFMDAMFFGYFFVHRGIKALQEFAETDNMDQFMGNDIQAESK